MENAILNRNYTKHDIRGAGIGLRSPHVIEILETKPKIPWFEILAENYFAEGGVDLSHLDSIRSNYPMVFHCVGMNLGSTDEINTTYFRKLLSIKERFQPTWISDHICWGGVGGSYLHDLLPIPYTEESLNTLAINIDHAQSLLKEPILLENVSTYLDHESSTMDEANFVSSLAKVTGCKLLLDINNIYVNSVNHGFDPKSYLQMIPQEAVGQFHLAGHTQNGSLLLDTHSKTVAPPVWELYDIALQRFGPIPTLLEWDQDIPDLTILLGESEKAQEHMDHHL
jgi:hypothetical protein